MYASDEKVFEDRIRALVSRMNGELADSVFGMMEPQLEDCDLGNQALTLRFPARHWERNGSGAIHGGVICSMVDTAMGTLTYALTGSLTPTINLTVSYPRPAPTDGVIFVRPKVVKLGRSIISLTAECWDGRQPGNIVATATGTFRSFEGQTEYHAGGIADD